MESAPFAGRVALVTGGSRGIGRACCLRLARGGADVAVNYRDRSDTAELTAESAREAGVRAVAVQADVTDPAQVQSMVKTVTESLGPIDLLVNNAGILTLGDHRQTTAGDWQQTLDVNLNGTFHVTWAVKDGMVERGFGRIVNLSSVAGLRPRPQCIAYAVSKAAVISLTQSLAEGLARQNVRVNAVAPGLTDTDMQLQTERSRVEPIVQASPIPRMASPDEIAAVVEFLLSEQSSFMTGQTLVASGGRVMLP